jgi:hypothetical protein
MKAIVFESLITGCDVAFVAFHVTEEHVVLL